MTPNEHQFLAKSMYGYGPISLRRMGDFAIVEIEYPPGSWVEVIREHIDGNFSHVVEPLGIQAAIESKPKITDEEEERRHPWDDVGAELYRMGQEAKE